MYKIIAAVNSMITNQQFIENATRKVNEIFFMYNGRFKWSIARGENGDYFLHYYPGNESLKDLVAIEHWDNYTDYVTYSTVELKSKEAIESFSELYQVVQSKLYGIDEILDSIINTAA